MTGGAISVINGVMQSANMPNNGLDSGAGQFSVSESGSVAYLSGGVYSFPERSLVWVDRAGVIKPLDAPPHVYIYPRLSPDGKRILFSTQGDRNVWIYDISRGTTTRVTTDGRSMAGTWTPDGKRIIFGSATTGPENLFWKTADGSEHGDPLATGTTNQRAAFTSPDGQRLFFTQAETNISNIWVLPLAGKQQPQQVLKTRFNENYPAPSPDGQWLAYVSDESGRAEVYVQPYPGPGAKVSISANGGTGPAWRADGRELYYQEPIVVAGAPEYKMMAVAVTAQPSFTAEKPRMLFQTPFGYAANVRGYDVTPDGQRFLMVQPKDTTPIKPAEVILVQNWFEELKRRVPVH